MRKLVLSLALLGCGKTPTAPPPVACAFVKVPIFAVATGQLVDSVLVKVCS